VVVFLPPDEGGVAWPAWSLATAELVTAATPTTPQPLAVPQGAPAFTTSGPAAVLVVPELATGRIRIRWSGDARCVSTDGAPLGAADGAVTALPLTRSVGC
jgi:hypothetical protein